MPYCKKSHILTKPTESFIRKGKYHLATPALWRSGYPPWNLKQGGLKSSCWRLISSIGKTKIIAFFLQEKKKKLFKIFWYFEKKMICWNFLICFMILRFFLTIFFLNFLDFWYFFMYFLDSFWFFKVFFWYFLDFMHFLEF